MSIALSGESYCRTLCDNEYNAASELQKNISCCQRYHDKQSNIIVPTMEKNWKYFRCDTHCFQMICCEENGVQRSEGIVGRCQDPCVENGSLHIDFHSGNGETREISGYTLEISQTHADGLHMNEKKKNRNLNSSTGWMMTCQVRIYAVCPSFFLNLGRTFLPPTSQSID